MVLECYCTDLRSRFGKSFSRKENVTDHNKNYGNPSFFCEIYTKARLIELNSHAMLFCGPLLYAEFF